MDYIWVRIGPRCECFFLAPLCITPLRVLTSYALLECCLPAAQPSRKQGSDTWKVCPVCEPTSSVGGGDGSEGVLRGEDGSPGQKANSLLCLLPAARGKEERLVTGSDDFTLCLWTPASSKVFTPCAHWRCGEETH